MARGVSTCDRDIVISPKLKIIYVVTSTHKYMYTHTHTHSFSHTHTLFLSHTYTLSDTHILFLSLTHTRTHSSLSHLLSFSFSLSLSLTHTHTRMELTVNFLSSSRYPPTAIFLASTCLHSSVPPITVYIIAIATTSHVCVSE